MVETAESGLRYSRATASILFRYGRYQRNCCVFVSSLTLGETVFEASVLLRPDTERERQQLRFARFPRFCCKPEALVYSSTDHLCSDPAKTLSIATINSTEAGPLGKLNDIAFNRAV